jgi:hypothetical protein
VVVLPSVLLPLFLCELCLLEGFSVASPEGSVPFDVSALEALLELFELFVPEFEELSVDSPLEVVPFMSSPR